MYQILMTADKSLITTERIKIYQREKMIDKIQFIIPKEYNSYDLLTFIPYLKYVDQVNGVHTELLTVSNDNYKENYFTCVLPIDTDFTKYAGDITLRLQLTKYDEEHDVQLVLTTSEDIVTVSPVTDLYEFIPDESLDAVTQLIGELDNKIKTLEIISDTYAENQVDDLEIDHDTDTLYVTASGVRKGNGVEVMTSGDDGSLDGHMDGVIDINDIPPIVEI